MRWSIYDDRTQVAHCLSAEAAAVWTRCDGRLSLSELAQQLALAPDVVERAVDALHDCGLLDEDPAPSRGYSRREAAVKLAKAGGAAFAAPLIYSAAVGSAASAASTHVPNGCKVAGCTASCSTPGSRRSQRPMRLGVLLLQYGSDDGVPMRAVIRRHLHRGQRPLRQREGSAVRRICAGSNGHTCATADDVLTRAAPPSPREIPHGESPWRPRYEPQQAPTQSGHPGQRAGLSPGSSANAERRR